jgi:hypothetical protein
MLPRASATSSRRNIEKIFDDFINLTAKFKSNIVKNIVNRRCQNAPPKMFNSCNLLISRRSAVTDTTIVAAAPSGFTLTAADGADPKVCFKAPGGNNDQYYATMTNLTQEMKTEDGCAYGVLNGTVTWCLAPNDCSDMPALTFFYAGADGGSIKPKSSNGAQLYKACNSNCTDNNPWGALGSTFNLNLTESAAQNPQFDRVVKDICKNAAFADAEYVNCTAV